MITQRQADILHIGEVFRVLQKDSPNKGKVFLVAGFEAPYFKLTELGGEEIDDGHYLGLDTVPSKGQRENYFQLEMSGWRGYHLDKIIKAVHEATPYFADAKKLELNFDVNERSARIGFWETLEDSIFGRIDYSVRKGNIEAIASQIDVIRLGIKSTSTCGNPKCQRCGKVVDQQTVNEVVRYFEKKGLASNLAQNISHDFGKPDDIKRDTYIGAAEAFIAQKDDTRKQYASIRSARDELLGPLGELSRGVFPVRR